MLAGGEPITPRLFIGRMLLGGFVSMVAGVVLVQFPDLSLPAVAALMWTRVKTNITSA
ncbi:hypothetical protein ABEM13_19150 [Escherichia coli]